MRILHISAILVLVAVSLPGAEADPSTRQIELSRLKLQPCWFGSAAIEWDFALGDQGFTTTTCDPSGGAPVWEWGTTSFIPGAPGTVWGTILDGGYPPLSGQGLLSPPFACTGNQDVLEILAYIYSEPDRDGGNVTVNDTVVPVNYGSYPGSIDAGAPCVGGEEGFSGPVGTWEVLCFDLSGYWGQTIQVRFDFGSDAVSQGAGWYIAYAAIGDDFIPVELQSFNTE